MFDFTLTSAAFNNLQRRLATLTSSDKSAVISFKIEESKLQIFYSSKLDKSDSISLFHESVEITSSNDNGLASLLISNLLSLKVPEFISEDKVPNCKFIKFTFNTSILTVDFAIKWNRYSGDNLSKLNFALLETSEDLKAYEKLCTDYSKDKTEIESFNLIEGISQCNFIKTDVTSKESNGSLFLIDGTKFFLVGTDSNMAVKYENAIVSTTSTKPISIVLHNSILNYIKSFITDTKSVILATNKSSLYLSVDNRTMLVPVMQLKYIIDDPKDFFNLSINPIASIDLKPVITLINNLTYNSNDLYKRLVLDFDTKAFSIKTEVNSSTNIPAEIFNKALINVNGDFFSFCCQKMLPLDLTANIYFDTDTDKITLTAQNNKLVFLIQGLST